MKSTARFQRALVPLDGSPLAESIIPFVLDIAGPLDMGVVLLRVVPPVIPDAPLNGPRVAMKDLEGKRAEAQEYLAATGQHLWNRGVRVQSRVRCGFPADEIVAAGRETAANLIAMTTHGRSGFKRLVFGSVAEAVLREAECPVLLLRADAPAMSMCEGQAGASADLPPRASKRLAAKTHRHRFAPGAPVKGGLL
jgi:nucleotide-binding universal stress UspA family protein